jgi:N-hydroxyarylamine O-acetyltransferase
VFDLDAYLARIGLSGRPTLAQLHRAHLMAVPFENLDPRRGVPVSLDLEDLQRKLVVNRRGGYCFEQNLLLKAALEALGADVDMFLARVRVGAPSAEARARSHLVLGVHVEGETWHADVGFGRGSLLEPVPFGPGGVYEQAGWRFQVARDRAELVLQTTVGDRWVDLYGFIPEPVPMIDVRVSNWYTCTWPSSPFVTGLVVTAYAADGSRATLTDRDGLGLIEETPTDSVRTAVEWDAVPEILCKRFALEGFALDGRLAPLLER